MKLLKRFNHGKQFGLAQRPNKDRVDSGNAGNANLRLLVKARYENYTEVRHFFFEG